VESGYERRRKRPIRSESRILGRLGADYFFDLPQLKRLILLGKQRVRALRADVETVSLHEVKATGELKVVHTCIRSC
jgi:hypothetical protein